MRKLFGGLILCLALALTIFVWHEHSQPETLAAFQAQSSRAFVYDYADSSLQILTQGSSRVYPASTTKLLTALLALDTLSPDAIVHPGDEVYFVKEQSTIAYIRPNHALTVEMLVEAMLLPSGNDAAYALAAACGRELAADAGLDSREAVARFVEEMNAYAASLGCTGSRFTTPDGLAGDEHHSTLEDMSLIARAAAENQLILTYAGLAEHQVVYASGHTNTWANTNLQLNEASPYYNPHILGLKTGSLPDNYCLISLYDDGGSRYLVGVFGAPTSAARYEDAQRILDLLK